MDTSYLQSMAKALVSGVQNQWLQGQPYRDALVNALRGNLQPANQLFNTPSPVNPQQALDAAMTFSPMGIGAIKAYHGSPYSFDKFDMSKIGTGEGAQAYGHGLYFAESPDVAKSYAGMAMPKINVADDAHVYAAKDFIANGMDPVSGLKSAYKNITTPEIEAAVLTAKGGYKPNLYQISLEHPDPVKEAATPLNPDDFLHWDKPIADQPNVFKKIRSLVLPDLLNTFDANALQGISGANAYKNYIGGTQQDATNALRQVGIPGIRYLDGNSRGIGDGTYNYVVFDDQIPKIIK